MENKDVCITIVDENNNEFLLEIQSDFKYKDLKQKIIELFKRNDFDINFQDKSIKKNNKILNLNEGDKIYLISINEDSDSDSDEIHNECYDPEGDLVNIKFHEDKSIDDDDEDMNTVDLSGLLKLCLLSYIIKNIENDYLIYSIESTELLEIIFTLRNTVDDKRDIKKDIIAVLSENKGKNIFAYSKYINCVVGEKEIKTLINLFGENKKNQIIKFWSKLSKYENFNKLFEKNLSKALEMSYFDYTLVSLSIIEKKNRKKYLKAKQKCRNCETKYLFHGTQIDPISKIVTDGFKYTRKAFYGMGIYFSDMLDYIAFYCGGKTYEDRRLNFGKTIPVGKTFSCIASEIYYDKRLKKDIYNWDYLVKKELDHFPTYEEIKQKYPYKMVKKNGIHFVRVEPQKGQVKNKEEIKIEEKKGNFIGTEYVITEMDQILALYGLTLKRSEYLVIWRDPGFSSNNQFSKYLQSKIRILNQVVQMNIYYMGTTEKALELINRKKYNKIILITNVGKDLSGRSFIEKAREFLGFDVMALFFSRDKGNLNWIKTFKNSLYTNNDDFLIEYITNYNKEGLIKLKTKIEKYYKTKFMEFTEDFLKFPKFVNQEKYSQLKFEIIRENFKKVVIINKKIKKALYMDKSGNLSVSNSQGVDINKYIWFITIFGDIIVFYSNHFYLSGIPEINTVIGEEDAKKWKFKKIGQNYIFYLQNENNILTIDGKNLTLSNNNNRLYQLFFLYEVK